MSASDGALGSCTLTLSAEGGVLLGSRELGSEERALGSCCCCRDARL